MTAITISRQLGSMGMDVARLTAQALEYRLVRREVIDQAARRAGAPEAALAAIDELGLLDPSPSARESRAYSRALREVMGELAEQGGVVIVGRAGQVILADRPGVLHVRIVAPHSVRISRVAKRYEIDREAATARIKASDRYRLDYVRRLYRVRWDSAELYDLVLNTSRLSVQGCVEMIRAASLALEGGPDTRAS